MSIDDRRLKDLVVESQDLQTDALRGMGRVRTDLREVGRERKGRRVDVDQIRSYNTKRRELLRNGGFGLGALAAKGMLGTAFGSAITAIVARPLHAQESADVQILQTAASLENLAVATYGAALGLDFIADGNATVKAFAETTMMQHDEHSGAFNSQAEELGGERQDDTNRMFQPVVDQTLPTLTDGIKVADFAATLENVATLTYVDNVGTLDDSASLEIMASIMGVEAQHLATLLAVKALLEADMPELVTVPPAGPAVDVAALPAAAGSAAFTGSTDFTGDGSVQDPAANPGLLAPPDSGAVQ